ncbi:hypothetical protein C8A05DRAFT_16978, partial [Staphylotrichum tortipilum]
IHALFLFKDVLKSNTTALLTSGFNTLILFGLGILPSGDIMYYSNTPGSADTPVATNGSYAGGAALAAKVRSLKTEPGTGVTRVEISMNAQNVQSLMASAGGTRGRLARNLRALKEAWGLDAVNNDDESIYDAASTVAFATLLGQLGYRYTISPYTVASYWAGVRAKINVGRLEGDLLLDRVYLQCYDGGAGNDPVSWQGQIGMGVVPLLWVVNDSKPRYGVSVEQARRRFEGWRGKVAGGGYWNDYDIEKMWLSYEGYGGVLKSVFP